MFIQAGAPARLSVLFNFYDIYCACCISIQIALLKKWIYSSIAEEIRLTSSVSGAFLICLACSSREMKSSRTTFQIISDGTKAASALEMEACSMNARSDAW